MHQSISFCSWKSNKKISEDPMKIRFRRDPVIKYQVILIFVLVLLVLIKVTLLIRYIATCKLYMFSSSTWVHYKVSQMSVCSCSVTNFRGWPMVTTESLFDLSTFVMFCVSGCYWRFAWASNISYGNEVPAEKHGTYFKNR